MDVNVFWEHLSKAKHARLKDAAASAKRFREPYPDMLIEIDCEDWPYEALAELIPMCEKADDKRSARALQTILDFKGGDYDKKLPNYAAFKAGLQGFLKGNHERGWVFYRVGNNYYPATIDRISTFTPRGKDDGKPHTRLSVTYFGAGTGRGYGSRSGVLWNQEKSWTWEPADVTRKSVPQILIEAGIYVETPELLAKYDAELDRYDSDMARRFAEQLIVQMKNEDGTLDEDGDENMGPGGVRKVIHDLKPDEQHPRPIETHSKVLKKNVPVPVHPLIYCFDLSTHDFYWRHVNDLEPYPYDPTLRDKLILPKSHRDLLDVLTSDLDVFSGDIIRGKSAGNIIVAKGLPGLGKTLTAEVYSELTETPIYAIHAGTLGTSASSVENALKVIFKRQRRWKCAVLLDEADVFVRTRGEDIVQNSIVAEFLRTLEYFEGLLFMTTNRPDDIDEAIVSRAAAIIGYDLPNEEHRRRIWQVMFAQNEVEVSDGLLDSLVETFPEIAPRDIKMLLRLTLRVGKAHGVEPSIGLFRKCAMFRDVRIAETVSDQDEEDLEDVL